MRWTNGLSPMNWLPRNTSANSQLIAVGFHFSGQDSSQRDLDHRGQDRDQGGQVDRMLGLARLHAHEREQLIDADDQLIGQIQVKLVNDEKQEDRKKIK
jgi:hypothetical protein